MMDGSAGLRLEKNVHTLAHTHVLPIVGPGKENRGVPECGVNVEGVESVEGVEGVAGPPPHGTAGWMGPGSCIRLRVSECAQRVSSAPKE